MKNLRYLLLAALVAMPLMACDEDDDPVVEPTIYGTITGAVGAEGVGIAGATISVVGAESYSATTGLGGTYTIENVEAGSYGVTLIVLGDLDVIFGTTSQLTVIAQQGQVVTVDFAGSYIRTASITGTVSSGFTALAGIDVDITGGPDNVSVSKVTGLGGDYTASGLRAGTYDVTIDPPAGVEFLTITKEVTVGSGEAGTAHFLGKTVELATIAGAVTVDNVGTAGIAVALSGDAVATTETGAGGAFSFTKLIPGSYTVTITAPADVTFDVLAKDLTVGEGDNGVLNFAGVGPKVPATISIKSITTGAGVPVILTNVFGQIEVSLNITRGDKDLDKVDVVFTNEDGTPIVVATQTFAAPVSPAEAAAGDQEIVTLSVPTNQITMGASTYVPVIFNGKANISANLWEIDAAAPIPTNDVPVVMNNSDVLMSSDGAMISGVVTRFNEGPSDIPTTVPSASWNTGGIQYDGPIYISFSTTVQTASWAAMACGAGVGTTAGTAATGITLSNTWACAAVEAMNQTPGIGLPIGYTGVALGPDGTAVTLPGAWSALGASFMLDGTDRWFVLTPGPAGLTPPSVFDIDNVGPTITMAAGAVAGSWGVAFNSLFDQPWINASYLLAQDALWVDGGVGNDLATQMIHLWDQGAPVCVVATAYVTGDDLDETIASDGTPDGYQICASGADLLGNVGTPSGPSNWFGVDKMAPLWRFHGTTAATPALVGTMPTVSAIANTTIYNIADGMPYLVGPDVWGLEGLDMRAGFNQNAVAGYPASQTMTHQTGLLNLSVAGPSAMSMALSDNFVRTASEWGFHDGFGTPGYYSYTGYVTDRAGNTTTPYVKNWLTDDVTAPSITFATFAAVFYAPGQPADFTIFGADDLEVIVASFTVDYPVVTAASGALQYDFTVGQRWDGLDPYDALAFSTAITGVGVQVPSLIGRMDFTCSGAAAPYPSCAVANALPVTLTDFNMGGTDAGMLPLSVTPISFEDAGVNLSGGAAPIVFNILQFSDSTAAPWDWANVPDIDFWQIKDNGGSAFFAEHTASTSIEDPFFDSIMLVLDDTGGTGSMIICGNFGVQTLTDNGINRFWTSGAARPATGTQCELAQVANPGATYHAVGVSGNALLVSNGIL